MTNWKKISLKDLAAIVSKELKNHNIDAVLVGGACVTIYSKNRYQSYDLDFAKFEDMRKIKKVMENLGFEIKGSTFSERTALGLLNLFQLRLL